MKVVAFVGSARKNGNTVSMVQRVFEPLEAAGIETELIQFAGHTIRGCRGCRRCAKNTDKKCAVNDDIVNECISKMVEANGIILATPSYFADVSAEMKALIDRAGMVALFNDVMLKKKVGAAISVARRCGALHTFDTLNHFLLINQMIVPGASYWNLGYGLEKGDVEKDEVGMSAMKTLGENMAWLLERIAK